MSCDSVDGIPRSRRRGSVATAPAGCFLYCKSSSWNSSMEMHMLRGLLGRFHVGF